MIVLISAVWSWILKKAQVKEIQEMKGSFELNSSHNDSGVINVAFDNSFDEVVRIEWKIWNSFEPPLIAQNKKDIKNFSSFLEKSWYC
jgi:hypothetical protein